MPDLDLTGGLHAYMDAFLKGEGNGRRMLREHLVIQAWSKNRAKQEVNCADLKAKAGSLGRQNVSCLSWHLIQMLNTEVNTPPFDTSSERRCFRLTPGPVLWIGC